MGMVKNTAAGYKNSKIGAPPGNHQGDPGKKGSGPHGNIAALKMTAPIYDACAADRNGSVSMVP